jgi:hypothetical protein
VEIRNFEDTVEVTNFTDSHESCNVVSIGKVLFKLMLERLKKVQKFKLHIPLGCNVLLSLLKN